MATEPLGKRAGLCDNTSTDSTIDNRLTAEIMGQLENVRIRNGTIINRLQGLRLHLLGVEIPQPSEGQSVNADNPGQLLVIRDMTDEIFSDQEEIFTLLDDLSRL